MQLKMKSIFLPVVASLLVSVLATYMITHNFYEKKYDKRMLEQKQSFEKESLVKKKEDLELYAKQTNVLFSNLYTVFNAKIKERLKAKVEDAYEEGIFIYQKYKGKKRVAEIQERILDTLTKQDIFVTDYDGDSILLGNQNLQKENLIFYLDANHHSLILEEIQAVRKHKEKFLNSVHAKTNKKELVYVKDFGIYRWFLGSIVDMDDEMKKLKKNLMQYLLSLRLKKGEFIVLYENNSLIFSTLEDKNHFDKKKYYTVESDFKPLHWHVFYGF